MWRQIVFEQLQRRWLLPALVATLSFAIDQVTKTWLLDTLGTEPGQRIVPILGDWMRFIYVQNTGVAFGMFQNGSQFFILTSLIICIGAIYAYAYQLPNHSRWIQLSLGLIIGGALGNVIDRILYGHVVDFVSIGSFPVFNVADSCICVGVAIMAIYLLINDQPPEPRPAPRDDTLLNSLLMQDSLPNEERRES